MAKNSQCGGCKDGIPVYTHTVSVQRLGTPSDGINPDDNGRYNLSDDNNWVTLFPLRVRFITKGGRESRIYSQIEATTNTVIRTPTTTNSKRIDPSWRLVMGTRKFNVAAAYQIDEVGREVQIEAIERRQPS